MVLFSGLCFSEANLFRNREGSVLCKFSASPFAAKDTSASCECPITVWTGKTAIYADLIEFFSKIFFNKATVTIIAFHKN